MFLAFLAEVTGCGNQREGFAGFLRAISECPVSNATLDSLLSSSVLRCRAQTGQFTSLLNSGYPSPSDAGR